MYTERYWLFYMYILHTYVYIYRSKQKDPQAIRSTAAFLLQSYVTTPSPLM